MSEKKQVLTSLEEIPAVTEAEVKAEAKPQTEPVKVHVKKMEVREKQAAAAPVESRSMTLEDVQKELESINTRLGFVETSQASAEARLKALEATGESVAKSLATLTALQAEQAKKMVAVEQTAADASVIAKDAASRVDGVDKKQAKIAAELVYVRRRQTPWGLIGAWWDRHQQHVAARRATMQALEQAEYEASVDALVTPEAEAEFEAGV